MIEGIRDTSKLQELTDQLEIIVSQPEKLSDEELFAQATLTYLDGREAS